MAECTSVHNRYKLRTRNASVQNVWVHHEGAGKDFLPIGGKQTFDNKL